MNMGDALRRNARKDPRRQAMEFRMTYGVKPFWRWLPCGRRMVRPSKT